MFGFQDNMILISLISSSISQVFNFAFFAIVKRCDGKCLKNLKV